MGGLWCMRQAVSNRSISHQKEWHSGEPLLCQKGVLQTETALYHIKVRNQSCRTHSRVCNCSLRQTWLSLLWFCGTSLTSRPCLGLWTPRFQRYRELLCPQAAAWLIGLTHLLFILFYFSTLQNHWVQSAQRWKPWWHLPCCAQSSSWAVRLSTTSRSRNWRRQRRSSRGRLIANRSSRRHRKMKAVRCKNLWPSYWKTRFPCHFYSRRPNRNFVSSALRAQWSL